MRRDVRRAGIQRKWVAGWLQRDWRKKDGTPVLNPELWRELLDEVAKHDLRWTWVRGHAGNPYNERCHELAVQACKEAIPGGWAGKRDNRPWSE